MNDVDKAFEKLFKREIVKEHRLDIDLESFAKIFHTAGAEYGDKQGRIEAFEDVIKKLLIFEDISSGETLEALGYKQGLQRNKALKYIDTELEKVKDE